MIRVTLSGDGETFLYTDGVYSFFINPKYMRVNFKKSSSVHAIVYFTKLGFEIDLSCMKRTNIDKGFMSIVAPEEWTESQIVDRLNTTIGKLTNLTKDLEDSKQVELEKSNIDNSTGEMLVLAAIHKRMRYLKTKGAMEKLLEFLNYFNLEVGRPKYPILTKGTNGIQHVYDTGFKWTKRLFEEGKLRRLTETEYLDKINNI